MSFAVIASSTLPPQVSVVVVAFNRIWGLHPRTVTEPPVLPPAVDLVLSLLLPPPQAAASSVTAETPATTATVRAVPRIDVLLRRGSPTGVDGMVKTAHRSARSPATHKASSCGTHERARRR